MKPLKQMGQENDLNPLNLTELLQYNAHSIDEQDELFYEHQDDDNHHHRQFKQLENDDTNPTTIEQISDTALDKNSYKEKCNSVQAEPDTEATQNSRLSSVRISSMSFDYLNPSSSFDNSSSDVSRSPSPLKMSRIGGGFSPEAKRKSSRSFLKISIPIRKASMSTSAKKTYQDKYISLEKIGQGSLGEVRRCKCINSAKEYAVKTIGFKDGEQLLNISREFFLLQSLKHPNLVRAHDFFIENKKCYIILDYIIGFSLQEFLQKNQKMNEEKTKFVMIEAMKAIQYLHQKGICHRDITTNNILIDEKKDSVKLIDFSNSKSCEYTRRMMTKTGTLSFMAPEIFSEQEYDNSVDMWSIGVVMFQLLTGCLPFYSESELGLIKDIQMKELDISQNNPLFSENISAQGIDLLNQLLQKNPRKRLSSTQALQHPWLKQVNLMCSFKKLSKRGSEYSFYKSPIHRDKCMFRQVSTQVFNEDFSLKDLDNQKKMSNEQQSLQSTHQTIHTICQDDNATYNFTRKSGISNTNLDTTLEQTHIEPDSFEDESKNAQSDDNNNNNKIASNQDNNNNIDKNININDNNINSNNNTNNNNNENDKNNNNNNHKNINNNDEQEQTNQCSPKLIGNEENKFEDNHQVLAPCSRFTNMQNPIQASSPPMFCQSGSKFSENNNDTNFNSKVFADQLILDIRKRSRSSIYYSQLQN